MAEFWSIYWTALVAVLTSMTLLWIVSVPLRNASIVDPFWGVGFVLCALVYASQTESGTRPTLVLALVTIWGLRLSIFLGWRNWGHGEDFRYQAFRRKFGPERYWWFSFFQVFLLQGALMWCISAPLLGAQYRNPTAPLGVLDVIGGMVWVVGFIFEAGSDWQLARFKADPRNQGQLLRTGFWRYTRHPNYFGDAAVWWAYGIFSIAAGSYVPALGSILMTALIVKVSGVALLETTLRSAKPGYEEYARRTSAFIPWFRRPAG